MPNFSEPGLGPGIEKLATEEARRAEQTKTDDALTFERYRELGNYLIRHLGATPINELTTAQMQRTIHDLEDHRGAHTKEHPEGRPLSPKTIRHLGTLLFTSLSEAERLGFLTIAHPMANKRVKLPKLIKRRPTVLDKEKLRDLFDCARGTRLYPFVVTAAVTRCRRGELLAVSAFTASGIRTRASC